MIRTNGTACVWLSIALSLAACSGEIQRNQGPGGSAPFAPGESRGGVTASGTTPSGSKPGAGNQDPGSAGTGGTGVPDVNRVGIHRLNNSEYDNTVRDLLGVSATPADTFIADEKALGFDNIAAALGMTDAQYEQYFDAAASLTDAVFADAKLRARIVTCMPASATDSKCAETIVRAFGLRAFRRPVRDDELDKLVALAAEATKIGEDFDGSIAHVVRAMLSSVPFLYRIELDPDPTSITPHPLDGYELASRLSYLLWSTMPDDALFAAAEHDELSDGAQLSKQLARMLADPRSDRFLSGFAAQWLGLRALQSHQVEPSVFPEFDEPLRDAMIREGLAYFDLFLHGERSLSEFFSADVNFVDDSLASLYGMNGGPYNDPKKPTIVTSDARRGFLGLASFLTLTSFAYRTAPTLRGKWVLENLLCQEIPPPPPNVPQLVKMDEVDQSLNVRERLAEHRANPTCASCHATLDPIGLGLESFDAIGRYRERYAEGDMVDASGMLPSGETFDGLLELSSLLAKDDRLADCASQKLLTYALSRKLEDGDQPFLAAIRERFARDGGSVRALLEQIVLSEPFRNRRGEPEP
jgi:hypothetical protein